ncbi:MAG: hypothetical protein VKK04_22555 [Synechococcales bacterium]|nr:hypothetical protein [Synechococcales bacterium]
MKFSGWKMGGLALLLMAIASCGGEQPQSAVTEPPTASQPAAGESGEPVPFADMPSPPSPEAQANSPTNNDVQPLPPPPLLPPTSATQRLPQVDPGRADPFAPLVTAPRVVAVAPTAPGPALPATPVPASPNLPPVPFATTPIPVQPSAVAPPSPAATVPSPAAPSAPASAPPSSAALPSAPPAPPPSLLAEAIEVSGVVEVGGRTNIIVQVPNERTSRYVGVGETLANGQVLVKRVESSPGGDPLVILEQNGREVIRTVGSASMVSMER